MKTADAHCDTLTSYSKNPLHSGDAHWDVERFSRIGGLLQYFAIFTPPELSGDSALRYAVNSIGNFFRKRDDSVSLFTKKEDWNDSKINILLSLEGASPIVNDLNNLYAFYQLGVRAMGLTWNHRNFAADGIDNPFGLTSFGKELVREMENLKMIVDVSHLNEAGFDDVVSITKRPFIASHSNAAAICNHKRNLTDDQIAEIAKRGGFIGINLYSGFLGDENDNLKHELLRHIEHFLNRGAEDVLGFGTDFDGIDRCPFNDVSAYPEIIDMLRNDLKLNESLIEKIMGLNLINFTLNNF